MEELDKCKGHVLVEEILKKLIRARKKIAIDKTPS
jgi:hypothetical protein